MTIHTSILFKAAPDPRSKLSYWLVPGIVLGALIWVGIFVAIF